MQKCIPSIFFFFIIHLKRADVDNCIEFIVLKTNLL